jgi:two-component system OmpR family response regulator
MRVLVVEDDVRVAAAIRRGLRSVNAVGDVATTSSSACTLLADTLYDVIVLDVKLPDADGFVTCRRLRSAGNWTPIIMLTGRARNDDRIRGLDAGADDYLTKPFAFDELLARVRALLRRRPILQQRTLVAGDLRIDTVTRRVTRGSRSIELTAKEYSLLEYLASRPNEVVTRAEIAEHVWDERYDPFSNLIEVYVQRLRRKLSDRNDGELIHTRRGQGYVFSTAEGA